MHTAIVKVKSQTGIIGNDDADRLARSAADKPNENDAYAGIGGALMDCSGRRYRYRYKSKKKIRIVDDLIRVKYHQIKR